MDKIKATTLWSIRKFASNKDYELNKPYHMGVFRGNLLLNEGIVNEIASVWRDTKH